MNTPRPIPELSADDIARFWEKVDKNGPTPPHVAGIGPCWVWLGCLSKAGYGSFNFHPHGTFQSHRISFHLAARIPAGMWVLHRCDNPACCNPSHLFLGGPLENTRDMIAKGRAVRLYGNEHWTRKSPEKLLRGDNHPSRLKPETRPRGERHYIHMHPESVTGENNGNARLKVTDVQRIRHLLREGVSPPEIAREFGVTKENIYAIAKRKLWKHVP